MYGHVYVGVSSQVRGTVMYMCVRGKESVRSCIYVCTVMYMCVRGIKYQESVRSCICVLGVSSQESVRSCICVC